MVLRDIHQGLDFSSQFRVNRFQFPRDMYAHAHVFTQPGSIRDIRRHPRFLLPFSPLRFMLAFFFISGALPRISSNQTCRNCGSRSDSAFFLRRKRSDTKSESPMINRIGSAFFVRNVACVCDFSHFMVDLPLEFHKFASTSGIVIN